MTYTFLARNTVTTPSREEASTYNCGIPPEILITNQEPLKALNPGDRFTAGDFPVRVVEAIGGNGTFSGKGVIEVPYLGLIRIGVRFQNISINTDRQMTGGTVETQYDQDFATGTNAGSVDLEAAAKAARDAAVEVAQLAGDVTKLIKESLNLDIDRDTKEKINQVADAMMENMNDADLPDEMVAQAAAAATKIKKTKESYDKAVAGGDTKAAETAQKEFKSAQDNLADTEKDIDRYKKEVADLLKEAITELYREGRDTESSIYDEYAQVRAAIDTGSTVEESKFLLIDEELIEQKPITEVSETQEDLNEIEKKIGVYLFAKILTEEDMDGSKLDVFIEDAKQSGTKFYKEIARLKEEGKSKNEIVTFLKGELKDSFTAILVNNIPEF